MLFLIDDFTTFALALKTNAFISQKTVQVVFGLLLGLFVLAQTVPSTSVLDEAKDTTEQSGTKDDHKSQQLSISEAIPYSTVQINLNFQSFLLQEIATRENESENESPLNYLEKSATKAFKVLFNRIISTNAP
ncbi:MAG: hypothetical protein Tsb0034_05900 [Ekhidna sp.]